MEQAFSRARTSRRLMKTHLLPYFYLDIGFIVQAGTTLEVPSGNPLPMHQSGRERGAVIRARAVDNAWLLRAYIFAAVGRRGSAIINRSKPSACACRGLAPKG